MEATSSIRLLVKSTQAQVRCVSSLTRSPVFARICTMSLRFCFFESWSHITRMRRASSTERCLQVLEEGQFCVFTLGSKRPISR